MQFDSITFLSFLLVVLCLYYGVSSWRARKLILLIASYLFYSAWNPFFLPLIAFSTAVDWVASGRIRSAGSSRSKKSWLLVSLGANLGLLGYFKYANFLLDSFNSLVNAFGLSYSAPPYDIVLPVGISFYTFQTLSYTIDTYRGRLDRAGSFLDYALFVAFFPQLVAGPIVRAAHFLPQCSERKRFDSSDLGIGSLLILIGIAQKVVLADAVFAPVVDRAYASPESLSAAEAWVAVLSFSGQIFFDFSGYTLCAIGAGRCLGFNIPENFRAPYFALGFSDFWARWHISLSTWLRDYLYIPLGGNRGGDYATLRNLGITMLLGGLWHGASWMFILWGGLHGVYLVAERSLGVRSRSASWRSRPIASGLYSSFTFIVVSLTWVFFRSPDLSVALGVLRGLARGGTFAWAADESIAVAAGIGMVALHWYTRDQSALSILLRRPPWVISAVCVALMLLIFFFTGGDERAFIYFQF